MSSLIHNLLRGFSSQLSASCDRTVYEDIEDLRDQYGEALDGFDTADNGADFAEDSTGEQIIKDVEESSEDVVEDTLPDEFFDGCLGDCSDSTEGTIEETGDSSEIGEIDKEIIEFSIYDSRQEHDKQWLKSAIGK